MGGKATGAGGTSWPLLASLLPRLQRVWWVLAPRFCRGQIRFRCSLWWPPLEGLLLRPKHWNSLPFPEINPSNAQARLGQVLSPRKYFTARVPSLSSACLHQAVSSAFTN